jgi:glycosyltransferase involved in cell wall biosynthesis
MKKILLLSHKFNPDIGGIETVSEILAVAFYNSGYIIKVVTRSSFESDQLFNFDIIRNPGIKELIKLHIWADVVFENNPCVGLSWPALLLNKPTVIALHTWIAQPNGEQTLIDKLKKMKLRTAKAVIAVSNVIKDKTFKKAIVIPNPFKVDLFINLDSSKKSPNFVFLGRLVSDKGVDLAIDAIAKLNKEDYHCNLTIIGDGPDRKKLMDQVVACNLSKKIKFTGSLSGHALTKELCKNKYMVIPSRWKEPFGVVALEGLACGCIPIVADGGGLPDAIGNAGLVFKRGDLNDLVTKMKLILTDSLLESELKLLAQAQVTAHHPVLIAKRYLDILKDVC